MKKSNFHYLKRGLIFGLLIALVIIIKDLVAIGFTDGFSGIKEVFDVIRNGMLVGLISGLILGVINLFAKMDTIIKK